MFELYQLRYFLAVVETGSFTKAAERVHVTQPTLSAGIKKLEDSLGVDLFQRSSRRVFLTEAGTRFVSRAKSILYECNQATLELSSVEAPLVLRVGVLRTIPAMLVARLLGDFRRHDPAVVVELFEGTEQEIQNRLDDGSTDIGLTILRSQDGDTIPLLEEDYRLAIAENHPLAEQDVVDGAQLGQDTMIVRTRCELLSETSRYFTDLNVRPRLVYRTQQDERALQMVAAGLGATIIPESYQMEGVRKIKLRHFEYRRTLGLVLSPHRMSKQARALVLGFVHFAESQNWQSIPTQYSV